MEKKFNLFNPSTWFDNSENDKPQIDPVAHLQLRFTNVQSIPFDGEKNPGNVGPIIDYVMDHARLSIRSWQALSESELALIAVTRLVAWVIGKGLKLQSEPIMEILQDEGIKLNKKKFTASFETRFNLFRKLKSASWSGEQSLNELSDEAEKNAIVGGDILVVLRVVKGKLKIQHIDGIHVQSPRFGTSEWPEELASGNLIIDGVEINSRREHIAYYVKVWSYEATGNNFKEQFRFERIEAYSKKTGFRMAYFYYGGKHRVNDVRGLPLFSACFEKLTGISLYSEAALKQAQEAAKVDYQQVTQLGGVGSAPWASSVVQSVNRGGGGNSELPVTDDGVQKLSSTKVTSIGTVYNPEPGSEIKMLKNENPLYFKDFYITHSDTFFAVVEIPPNVAMGKYEDSFSASRMATGDWANTLIVKRDKHQNGYQKPIIDLWLHLEIMEGRIQAPGYILAWSQGNMDVIEAYRNVRLIGSNVPAVDSKKEAEAVRILLGKALENLPLIDGEQAAEGIGTGDIYEIIERVGEQLKLSKSAGIKPEPVLQQVQKNTTKQKAKNNA